MPFLESWKGDSPMVFPEEAGLASRWPQDAHIYAYLCVPLSEGHRFWVHRAAAADLNITSSWLFFSSQMHSVMDFRLLGVSLQGTLLS